MKEFSAFLRAVASHWIFLMSGGISVALSFVERIFHWPIPNSVYWIVGVVCLFTCCFLAWRDEFRRRPSILSELQEFIKTGHSCYIAPVVPHSTDELFQPLSVTSQLLKLRVNRTQGETLVPLQRIKEFLPSAGYRTLIVDGRLQWITRCKKWEFFPEQPQTDFGVPKQSSRTLDSRINAIEKGVQEEGFQFYWRQVSRVVNGSEIFYDSDGRYLSADTEDSKMILIVGRK